MRALTCLEAVRAADLELYVRTVRNAFGVPYFFAIMAKVSFFFALCETYCSGAVTILWRTRAG